MNCFVKLVDSNFLKKANKELDQAQQLILTMQTPTGESQQGKESNVINWTFSKSTKQQEFNRIWNAFQMDTYLLNNNKFVVKDHISVVEDDEVSILCSPTKRLIEDGINHYYYVYGDWCFYRTKKRIGRGFIYFALVWKAFPIDAFPLN